MAELKAGALAIVISSEVTAEIGRTVTLIKRIYDGEFYRFPDGSRYSDESASKDKCWVVSGDVSVYTDGDSGGMGIFPSWALMPIDGDDFSHEDERQKELAHG